MTFHQSLLFIIRFQSTLTLAHWHDELCVCEGEFCLLLEFADFHAVCSGEARNRESWEEAH